ncbi:aromatic amino acid transport family protein [Shewanella frigidimarina]|jgi:serine transporter|uniref:Aromatic amino acid permease n=1 Tax=Shewanella frigidimarina (strain NCIMB 400) TaxID=318167 RepID=Q087L9_SHEFN|nr:MULTISPECIES: aromatic amino acid transport family protein [Shewanella]ABI70546.1 aromatic amino acid permease [Shewanella frigidimarina NCIMB 400]MBB1426974.1 septum formation protein [Shewanella sp. SG44-2]PKH99597.1 septum formation protein [Shewanella sp. 11B5]RPA31686.1 septum formation protein [Shewanella frigidimarina]HBF45727.1 septum formation protein [Shewanella frigidimarina]|tara:strand:- start:4601 stop:5860 length:1260 start_codon:yes stop_codon:yes gene_type:complete
MSSRTLTNDSFLPVDQSRFNYQDFTWCLSLFGTAVGAGVLFLPIKAGAGGFWPLVILALIAAPMTWFAHKSLARFVLSSTKPESNITDTVEEHFGKTGANLISFAYFFAIFPIVLIYGVGITNTVDSFMVNQMGIASIPRWILSGGLILAMTGGVVFGRELMLKVTSILVYPLVFLLLALSIYLIPDWNTSMMEVSPEWSSMPSIIWLSIPLIVFSFNHSPIISQFTKEQRRKYGQNAVEKTDAITGGAALMLMGFVMFFVFSVVLSLSPEQLLLAKEQNISILSYLANEHESPMISLMGPIVAFTAITSSYFGHFLGAHEGLVGVIKCRTTASVNIIEKASLAFIVLSTWVVAIVNPSILGMIEAVGAPMIAAILFLMPVFAMHKVPAMAKYKTSLPVQIFTVICGLAAISSVLYDIF